MSEATADIGRHCSYAEMISCFGKVLSFDKGDGVSLWTVTNVYILIY